MNKKVTEEDKIKKACFTRPAFHEITLIIINCTLSAQFCVGGLLNENSRYVSRFSI